MKEYNISHPTQLNSLSTLPFIGVKTVGKLKLKGNMREHPQRKDLEKLLNKHYYACGCDTGSITLLIGLILTSGYFIYSYSIKDISILSSLGTIIGVSIASSIIGKVYGLFRANQKLKKVIEQVKKEWKPEKEFMENWSCG